MGGNLLHYTRRCWAEIDLDALRSNFELLRQKLQGALPMAVVKADGYAHGALPVAHLLQKDAGVEAFAVSNLDVAVQLPEGGISGMILILGYTPPEEAERLHAFRLTQTLLSPEYAQMLNEQAKQRNLILPVHIAIDTGMNRIGFSSDLKNIGKLRWSNLLVEGAFTHFCHADSTDLSARAFTEEQLRRFEDATDGMSGRHIQNTAGLLTGAGGGFDYARIGIALYGLSPSAEVTDSRLQPVMSLKSVISMLKVIPPGSTVGYGRTWRADRETVVATVPLGYADGYSRSLSNRAEVLIRGKRARIIGNICMDQLMVDATGIDAAVEDEVTLFGRDRYGGSITADELARDAGTIGYEIVCMISKRVPRVYLQNGKPPYTQLWM